MKKYPFNVGDEVKYIGPGNGVHNAMYIKNKVYLVKFVNHSGYHGIYIPCEQNLRGDENASGMGLWQTEDLERYFTLAKVKPLERLPAWW